VSAVILVNVDLLYKASNFGSLVTFVAISGGIFTAHELAGKFLTLPFKAVRHDFDTKCKFFFAVWGRFPVTDAFQMLKVPLGWGREEEPRKRK